MDFPILPKPPLKEAVLQITVEQTDDNCVEKIMAIAKALKERYPKQTPIFGPQAMPTPEGIKCSSTDEKTNIILRKDLVAYSCTGMSYSRWANFYPVAIGIYNIYAKRIKVEKITQLSLRFINEIPFDPNESIEGYNTLANLFEFDEYAITGSFVQTRLISKKHASTAHIREVIEPRKDALIVFLDIDVQSQLQESIDGTFDILRNFKNEIFFKVVKESIHNRFK